ncbi:MULTISPECIES: ABC transporter permease [unclassified Lysinibacillus]|uniref:ABC transporter permease n=1 Tax=unclassified Lysinibacillus TaxID=2636778 RepID=UPI0020114268|nr:MULTISPECIES: ABC transporter permease [unclassified Lysinibacillus]MCL1696181.1 ABC transporter permease [Lysinibacillus sp. BPa_S21]MCL1700443.1 ABC transporter permease [Lysinibacillus sp. Bpr_S20]
MMKQIARIYMLESIRNTGMSIGNLSPAFIFLIMSVICKNMMSGEAFDYLVKGQFLPVSILMLIFSFAFSSATIYLADMKANKTFQWIQRTGVKPHTYYMGMGIGVFTLLNVFLVLLLIGYSFIIDISLSSYFMIILISNFVLLALYPLSFILAGLFKNEKVAQSMLVPIMILFMFSVTMTTMFLTIGGKNPHDYYIFLSWNPMLYLNDSLQKYLNLINDTWLPQYQYCIILAVISFGLASIAKKVYISK